MSDERRATLIGLDAVIRALLEDIAQRDPAYGLVQLASFEQNRYPYLFRYAENDPDYYDEPPDMRGRYQRAATLLTAAEILGYQHKLGPLERTLGRSDWQELRAYLDAEDMELARQEGEEIAATYR